jgi:tRNA-modifying protein YgfZ
MTLPFNGSCLLPHLGVIRAQGADATAFLQGQLTQDVALLPVGQTALAAWCSAKGRMLASFQLLKAAAADDYWLVCHQDILEATRKRLAMFVLRAKVKLSDESAGMAVWGLVGADAMAAAAQAGGHRLALAPSQGLARALWIGPSASAPPAPDAQAALPLDAWQALHVLAGVADISQPVAEAFVPQMLNYESVGGVNFKKGCYPGQEVVARSQFRGTLKRRAYVLAGAAPMQAGQEVFSAADPDQACGTVAQAASVPAALQAVCAGQPHVAIASLQIAAVQAGGLCLGAADGPALQLLPLPYALLEDI